MGWQTIVDHELGCLITKLLDEDLGCVTWRVSVTLITHHLAN